MKIACLFLSIVLCLSLISCGFGDITDPLGDDYEVPQEWQPILSEEEALEKYGLGDYRDTYDLQEIRLRECYDYCIYFRGNLKDPTKLELGSYNTLLRYDLRTGEILPACRDSACTHLNAGCPFYLKNTARYLIHGDIMYYMTLKVTDDGNVDTSKLASNITNILSKPHTLESQKFCIFIS